MAQPKNRRIATEDYFDQATKDFPRTVPVLNKGEVTSGSTPNFAVRRIGTTNVYEIDLTLVKGDQGGMPYNLTPVADVNTLVNNSWGVYRYTSTQAAADPNIPGARAGVLECFNITGSTPVQRYTVYSTPSTMFVRIASSAGAWGAWTEFSPTRIDKTAGIAKYDWDSIAQRWQLTYADTGTRDVTALATDGSGAMITAGSVWIERDARHVSIQIQNVALRDGGTVDLPLVPAGFRSIGGASTLVAGGATPTARRILSVGGNLRVYGGAAAEVLNGTLVYRVHDAYPSSLPGSPINTPPNS